MKSYFSLQCKRNAKIFPFVLAVTVLLLTGLGVILSGLIQSFETSEENTIFRIGITGDIDSEYLDWGLSTFQSLDETRFSIEIVSMEEETAKADLANGNLSAYVVIPDEFIEKAVDGEGVEPLRYVTAAGAESLTSMLKTELTKMITNVVIHAEKGTYGIHNASNSGEVEDHDSINRLSLEYVDLIFSRSEMLAVEELGISNGLSMAQYYLCGISILFLMLMGLPFAALYAKKDHSLHALLTSKGHSNFKQFFCEWLSHLLSLTVLISVIFALLFTLASTIPGFRLSFFPESISVWDFFARLMLVVAVFSAFNMMIFEFSGNVVSGVLLHFFSTLCMCYLSGCFYPIQSFPTAIQSLEAYLPTGCARAFLATLFTEGEGFAPLLALIGFGGLFFSLAFLSRYRKIVSKQGVTL